jgi:hypothetical protein
MPRSAREIGRVDAQSAATAQDRVDHRPALASLGMPDEQKILFCRRRWDEWHFHKDYVDLQPDGRHIPDQGVVHSLSGQTDCLEDFTEQRKAGLYWRP